MKIRYLAAALVAVALPALAADNLTVKDGTGATKVLGKKDVAGVLYDRGIVVLQSDVTVDAMAQIDGHVDGIESLLTTETSNTSGISAKLPATLGSKTGATSLSVVPANDGFSVQCTSGCSGGVQYLEDNASANGDTGTVGLAILKATPADTAGTDGDYQPLQMKNGLLWTNDKNLNTAIGAVGDSAWASGSGSVVSLLKTIANASLDTTPLSTNGTQINGNTMLAGNGVTGTGSQRVTVASDNTPFAVKTDQTTPGTTDLVHAAGFAGTATTTITRPADTTAYAANDAFADSTSSPTTGGFTLSSMCRASGGSGLLTDLVFVYSTATAVTGELWVYDSAPTAQNDNAAWSVSDSDQLKLVAKVPFSTVADTVNAVYTANGLSIGYTCSGSANLRYMVKITTAYTPASGDTLTVRAKYQQTN